MTFGRGNLQDFVARSRDVRVTASYLSAELNLELARAISFKTTDLVTFQRRMAFRYQPNQMSQRGCQE
jgi:hypothetical protein